MFQKFCKRVGVNIVAGVFCLTCAFLTQVYAQDGPKGAQNSGDQARVLAKVNDKSITEKDLQLELALLGDQLQRMGRRADKNQLQSFREQMLDEMIAWEVFYQEAQKQGLVATDEDVAERMQAFKDQFKDGTDVEAKLSEMGVTEAEMTSVTKKKMTIQALLEKEVLDKIVVTDEQTQAYYKDNPKFFEKPEMVRASHILIKVPDGADEAAKAEALKKIEKVQAKLKDGADFAELAKEYSDCPSSEKGGDLGPFGAGQMVKPFEEAAFALQPSEVSGIVETQFGYHLINVVERIPASNVPYEDVKEKIAEYLKAERAQKEVVAYADSLKEKAKIERPEPKKEG